MEKYKLTSDIIKTLDYTKRPIPCTCLIPRLEDCKQLNYPKGCYYLEKNRNVNL